MSTKNTASKAHNEPNTAVEVASVALAVFGDDPQAQEKISDFLATVYASRLTEGEVREAVEEAVHQT